LDGAVDIHENRDNVTMVNNLEHGRTYSVMATFSQSSNLWVDIGYHYMDIFTQTYICFADTGSTVFTTACTIPGTTGPLGTTSFYASKDHYAYADVMWKPVKRVTAMLGYAGSIVRGNVLECVLPERHAEFQLPKAFRQPVVRHPQGPDLQNIVELFRIQRSRLSKPGGVGGASIAGLQRQQCDILTEIRILKLNFISQGETL
jgi:hypothetical protein